MVVYVLFLDRETLIGVFKTEAAVMRERDKVGYGAYYVVMPVED